MEGTSIAALTVVYNTCCAESETCRSLLAQSRPPRRVLIFDNSTQDMGNRDFCRSQGWEYLGEGENLGLSKAYNRAIEHCRDMDWLCLLDDDTGLPADFFQTAEESMTALPDTDIWVPILTQNGRILSPWRDGVRRSRRFFGSMEECLSAPAGDLLAFNSGMLARMKIYADYLYDERIFLDGVDYRFLSDMRARGKLLGVIPAVCSQNFSGGERQEKSAALARFRIYSKDFRTVYEGQRLKYMSLVGRRALHLTLIYKDSRFLRELLHK